jgi:hypothetical protein
MGKQLDIMPQQPRMRRSVAIAAGIMAFFVTYWIMQVVVPDIDWSSGEWPEEVDMMDEPTQSLQRQKLVPANDMIAMVLRQTASSKTFSRLSDPRFHPSPNHGRDQEATLFP